MKSSIAAAMFAVLAIPTVASAHAGNNDPNVVHACIGNLSKLVRIVGVNGSCISSPPAVAETPAHWSIQGVAGTNGTNGTNGIDGTNGTNGTDGTSVTFGGYFSGDQNGCSNGGAIYQVGAVTTYVCNGTNGKDGTTARAAGPCFDDTHRYVDCGNGTVTDTVTGLIWLKSGACLESASWAAANQAAAALKNGDCGGSLTDGSSAGDWRLPTKAEWTATIAYAVTLGCTGGSAPSLTNDDETACQLAGPSSLSVPPDNRNYWSSTALDGSPGNVWIALLQNGFLFASVKDQASALRAWPVRGPGR
jgi:uncharacterized protein DUF1566